MSSLARRVFRFCSFFFFNDTATTEIYTLSLHDALPISAPEHPDRSPPALAAPMAPPEIGPGDRKSTRLNSSHQIISYAVFCLKKKPAPPQTPPKTHPAPTTAPVPAQRTPPASHRPYHSR